MKSLSLPLSSILTSSTLLLTTSILIIFICIIILAPISIFALNIVCGDNNNIQRPDESLVLNPNTIHPFPCPAITIRNSNVLSIVSVYGTKSRRLSTVVQNFTIIDTEVISFVDLHLRFFSDVQNYNNSLPFTDDSSITDFASIPQKPNVLLKRLKILGKQAPLDPSQKNGIFIPLQIRQYLIYSQSDVENRNYDVGIDLPGIFWTKMGQSRPPDSAFGDEERRRMLSPFLSQDISSSAIDGNQISSSLLIGDNNNNSKIIAKNYLVRNFIDTFIFDDCDINSIGDEHRVRYMNNFFRFNIGGYFSFTNSRIFDGYSGFDFSYFNLLNGASFSIRNVEATLDDTGCNGCVPPPERDYAKGVNGSRFSKGLEVYGMNTNHQGEYGRDLALLCSSVLSSKYNDAASSSTATSGMTIGDYSTSLTLENNVINSTKRFPDNQIGVQIRLCNLGQRRASSSSSSSSSSLPSTLIFRNNSISIDTSPADQERYKLPSDRDILGYNEVVYITSIGSVSRVIVTNNNIYSDSQSEFRGLAINQIFSAADGITVANNNIRMISVGDSATGIHGISVNNIGYKQLYANDTDIKNTNYKILTARYDDDSSLSNNNNNNNNNINNVFFPTTTNFVEIHSNTLNLKVDASSQDALATDLIRAVAIDFGKNTDIESVQLYNNSCISEFRSSPTRVSFITMFAANGGEELANIHEIAILDNTFTGSGLVHLAFAIGFENNVALFVKNCTVVRNHVDTSQVGLIGYGAQGQLLRNLALTSLRFNRPIFEQGLNLLRAQSQASALLLLDNSGFDYLRLQNNSFIASISPVAEITTSISIAYIMGRFTASPSLQPELSEKYPPYNKKSKIFIVDNIFRVAAPIGISPSRYQSDDFAAHAGVRILTFGPAFDKTASFTSLLLEGNNITSNYGGTFSLITSFGSLQTTSSTIIRRNSIFGKGIGSSELLISDAAATVWSPNVDTFAVAFPLLAENIPRTHSMVQFLGRGNAFSSSSSSSNNDNNNNDDGGGLLIEENSIELEDVFGHFAGFNSSICSYEYFPIIFNYSIADDMRYQRCGVYGNATVKNNSIKFSSNSRSPPRSSDFSLVNLGPRQRQLEILTQIDVIDNKVEFNGNDDESKLSRDQFTMMSVPSDMISGSASASSSFIPSPPPLSPSDFHFSFNRVVLRNCLSISMSGSSSSSLFLPSSSTFTNNELIIIPTSLQKDTEVSFVSIPSPVHNNNAFLLYTSSSVVIQNNTIKAGTIDNSDESDASSSSSFVNSTFIRFFFPSSANGVPSSSSSSSKPSVLLRIESNTITNYFDQDRKKDASKRYVLSHSSIFGPTTTTTNSQEHQLYSLTIVDDDDASSCNIINTRSQTEINPNFNSSSRTNAALSSIIINIDIQHQSSRSRVSSCKNFGGLSTRTKSKSKSKSVEVHLDEEDEGMKDSSELATTTNVAGSIGLIASTAAAAIVPSVGFGISRQQALVSFVQNVRDGDCTGVSNKDEIPAADSPTQLSIGSSSGKFYVGGTLGNVLLTFGFCLLVLAGGSLFLKQTGSSSWNRPYAVFARCHGAMILFICLSLLFAPTVKFGLVAATISDVPVIEKVIAVVFGVVVFGSVTIYYTYWSLLGRNRKESYRKLAPPTKKEKSSASFLARSFTFWFEGPGEWRMPLKHTKYGKDLTEKDFLDFDAATPMLDGFQGHAFYFGAVEFATQFGLAFAEFIAQLVPPSQSCLTLAIVLLVVFTIHLLLSLALRPFVERFNRIVVPIITLFEIIVLSLALYFGEAGRQPDFIVKLAMATVSMQSFVSLLVLVVSLSPLAKSFIRIFKRLKKKKSNDVNNNNHGTQGRNSSTTMFQKFTNLSSLMIMDERENKKNNNNNGNNSNNKKRDHHHHHQERDSKIINYKNTQGSRGRRSANDDETEMMVPVNNRRRDDTTSSPSSSRQPRRNKNHDDSRRGNDTRTSDERHRLHHHQSSSSSTRRPRGATDNKNREKPSAIAQTTNHYHYDDNSRSRTRRDHHQQERGNDDGHPRHHNLSSSSSPSRSRPSSSSYHHRDGSSRATNHSSGSHRYQTSDHSPPRNSSNSKRRFFEEI